MTSEDDSNICRNNSFHQGESETVRRHRYAEAFMRSRNGQLPSATVDGATVLSCLMSNMSLVGTVNIFVGLLTCTWNCKITFAS